MRVWLPRHGVAYAGAPNLGGRRTPRRDSPNIALRNAAFRGYADYMSTPEFAAAFDALLHDAERVPTAVLCSETLWWRCHRRLIADAAVALRGVDVQHLVGEKLQPHRLTEGARVAAPGVLVYDAGSASSKASMSSAVL